MPYPVKSPPLSLPKGPIQDIAKGAGVWAITRRLSCAAIMALLTGCEGTWASTNQVDLRPVGGSHISGIAGITLDRLRLQNHLPAGTNIEVQFRDLRDASRFVGLLQRGLCEQNTPTERISRFGLYANEDPNEGIQGDAHVDIPIHAIMKDGYSLSLVDRKSKRTLSCGDLQTSRPW